MSGGADSPAGASGLGLAAVGGCVMGLRVSYHQADVPVAGSTRYLGENHIRMHPSGKAQGRTAGTGCHLEVGVQLGLGQPPARAASLRSLCRRGTGQGREEAPE